MRSIRRNLLLALLGAMGIVMLVGAVFTYRAAREEVNEIFDYHLRQIALSVRDQAFLNAPPAAISGGEDFDFVIRVWDRSGLTVYYSRPHRALPDLARLGFSTVDTPDGAWRVFAVQHRDETIEVAQPLAVRREQAAAAALRTLTPFLLLLPALGALIWVIVSRGLRPLTRIAQSVVARTPSSLDPLREDAAPAEVQPLVLALNDLLKRLQSALEAQRAFIADAAHELRTPLAALQLQVQLVERAASDGERAAAIAELKGGLQRAIHSVQQLLTLARQEPGAGDDPFAPVSLAEVARRVVAELDSLAAARQIDLGFSGTGEAAVVSGSAEALRIMTTNLVSNAVRHTPQGGRIDVGVGLEDGRPFLDVADTGPGIPAAERERVFDRFYRRSTSAGAGEVGSGLGLAIVRTIAERHGAAVSLGDADGGGLRAHVRFPALKGAAA